MEEKTAKSWNEMAGGREKERMNDRSRRKDVGRERKKVGPQVTGICINGFSLDLQPGHQFASSL